MSSATATILPIIPKLPPVKRLSNGIIRILGLNPGYETFQGTNSYLLQCDSDKKRNLLIDTSSPNQLGYVRNVIHVLKNLGSKSFISDILISHWHADHVGSVNDLKEALKLETNVVPTIHKLASNSIHDTINFEFSPLSDQQLLDAGDLGTLQVVHTPGHTDDHVSFHLPQQKSLFTGDMILGHGSSSFEYLNSYMKSLKKAKEMGRDLNVMLPGHGDVINDPVLKAKEYINHRLERISDVHLSLDDVKWIRERDLLDIVYLDITSHLVAGASINMRQALIYLEKQQLVESKVIKDDNNSDVNDPTNVTWKRIADSQDQLKFEFD